NATAKSNMVFPPRMSCTDCRCAERLHAAGIYGHLERMKPPNRDTAESTRPSNDRVREYAGDNRRKSHRWCVPRIHRENETPRPIAGSFSLVRGASPGEESAARFLANSRSQAETFRSLV